MNFAAVLAVGVGAAVGAWLRWALGIVLNTLVPMLPLGTLASNLIGGYLIGIAVEYFAQNAGVSPEMRLLIITGFLGGLTTFSTFSAEAVTLLMRAHYGWAALLIVSHLAGSIFATILGMLTMKAFTHA